MSSSGGFHEVDLAVVQPRFACMNAVSIVGYNVHHAQGPRCECHSEGGKELFLVCILYSWSSLFYSLHKANNNDEQQARSSQCNVNTNDIRVVGVNSRVLLCGFLIRETK